MKRMARLYNIRPVPATAAVLVGLLVLVPACPGRAQAPGAQIPVFIGVLDLEANNIEEAEAKAIADRLRYRSPVLRPYLGIGHSKITIAGLSGSDFEQRTGLTVGFYLHLKRLVLRFGTMPATGTGGSFGLLYDFSPAPRKTAIQESRRDE
jgi:hypothetical protein